MKKIIKLTVLMILLCISQVGMSQNFTEPVSINFNGYRPKLILNDPNTANKVPIEFQTNNVIKWELGMRPISDGHDMALWNKYNGTYHPVMWFKNKNGFVGIGTNTVTEKLVLYKQNVAQVAAQFGNSSTGIGSGNGFIVGVESAGNGVIWNRENNFIRFGTNAVERMRIDLNGNIGIGTDSPKARLEIVSAGSVYTRTPTLTVKDLTNRGTMFLESATDNPTDFVFKNNNRFSWVMSTRSSSDNYALRFYPSVNGTSWHNPTLTMLTNGNVGIGTTNPGNYKLAVEGVIGAREIKVTLDSWSDFVLKKGYELKNLEKVERFIEENNHLPDIPSEKEVKENGIRVGEMNAKLLQKIEELTLYVIDLNKEMKFLKQKNVKLENEIEKLKLK